MAIVSAFFEDGANSKRHPTTVECGWRVVEDETGALLQLSTYGSRDRAIANKVSQTIQLNSDTAQQLLAIIESTLPRLRR